MLECKEKEDERVLGSYNSEIEAYKIYKRVSHKDKNIIKGNVFHTELLGVTVLVDYEEIKVIL